MTAPEGGFDFGQLQTDLADYCGRTGLFESVQLFELDGNVGQFVAAVFPAPNAVDLLPNLSGQGVMSVRVSFVIRLYYAAAQQTPDVIDPKVINAAAKVMKDLCGGFTFTESIYGIDILGEQGQKLSATAGYIKVGSPDNSANYRVIDIRVPVLLADVWTVTR